MEIHISLNCIKAAQNRIVETNYDIEYLPIDRLKSFIDNSLKLAYTGDCQELKDGRIVGSKPYQELEL